jgi:hypothetical protein
VELPAPYSKPVELIRQEEYPHMNQGNLHPAPESTLFPAATPTN